MHDPLTVAFEIRRPWPRRESWKTKVAAEQGVRWQFGGAFTVVAGRGLYWPSLITVWHHDPSGYDTTTCPIYPGNRWRFHVHHWRVQVHPVQQLRRRVLTRCEVCGGRSRKGATVNFSNQWDRPRGHWWQGETGLAHMECRGLRVAPDRSELIASPPPAFDVEVD